jgi:uncharacterized membrane protein
MYSKHRLEMLSDAVFAIAMTLLILDLKVPMGVAPGQLAAALMHEEASWFSFVLTFMLSATMWALQHRLFDITEKIDKSSLIFTFVFLGGVSILPFSTSLLGHYYVADRTAAVFYACVLFLISAALTLQFEWSRWKQHLRLGGTATTLRLELHSGTVLMGCAIAIFGLAHSDRSEFFLIAGAVLLSTLIARIEKLKSWKTARMVRK